MELKWLNLLHVQIPLYMDLKFKYVHRSCDFTGSSYFYFNDVVDHYTTHFEVCHKSFYIANTD